MDMDPYQFEFLIADLLATIGYEDVQVTRRSGDKGVDVVANLRMEGITDVKTVIQVTHESQAVISGTVPVAKPIQLAALTASGQGWSRFTAILPGVDPIKTITTVTRISMKKMTTRAA